MALAIAIEGLGVLSDAESTTGWGITGSGGASIALDTEIYLQGSGCINSKLSAGKNGWIWYNYGSALNFTTVYAGQLVYIWYQITTPRAMDTLANVGYSIRMGTDTSNYREWVLGGNDDLNGYTGGWACAVIDPTTAGTSDTGTYSATTVQYIGLYYNGSTASRAENVFVDTIAVGSGLRVTGTEATSGDGWTEVADYCNDFTSRAWGMVQKERAGLVLFGTVNIGDSTQSAVTVFSDSGQNIKFGDFEYYSGSAWVTGLPNGFHGLNIEDAASYTTTFTDGVLVGSDQGRSGSKFSGASLVDTTFDLYGGNAATSLTRLYGTTLSGIDGAVTWGNDSDHLCYSVTFEACEQFDPVGAVKIRNCVFAGYSGVEAALKWNANIDIQDCVFAGNTDGTNDPAAIEHEAPGDFTYTGLTFSGNDYDIKNSNNSVNTDSYSESNRDADTQLDDTNFAMGESFTGDGGTLGHAFFFLSKSGSPTGNAVAKIYAHTGTFGVDGIPTGAVLATSNPVAVTGLDGTPTLTKFIFPLAEQMTLVNTTKYFVVIEYNDGTSSNYVLVGHDESSPGHGGNMAVYTSSWAYDAGKDACFYVRTGGIVNIAASGSNPSQSSVNDSGTPEGTTSIINTVTIQINTVDRNNDPVGSVSCAIYRTSDKAELLNEDSSGAGVASEDFNYPGSTVDIYWRVRESPSGGGDRYKADSGVGVITAGGYSVVVTMRPETVS